MKLTTSIILIISTFQIAFGQVATIKDPDGWTNVRKLPDSKSEIIHKVFQNEVFWYDYESTDKLQDWVLISIPKNDFSLGMSDPSYIEGFIHKSRLLQLDSLNVYKGEDFSFKYVLSEFTPSNRIIDRQEGRWVMAIDGRPVWGTDGDFPRTQVDNIEVKIKSKAIKINKIFYSDIYECRHSFEIYQNGETYFVHQWNSDGAGAYEIVWVFDNDGLKQRLVGAMY
ncbi:hypothetical protein [Labilibaculum euxinus]